MTRFFCLVVGVALALVAHGQMTISIDVIKDDSIILPSNYKTIIQRTEGWKPYARYNYSKDSLVLDTTDNYNKYKQDGILEVTLKKISLTVHDKYKFKNNEICFYPDKELTKKMKERHYIKVKPQWTCQKIIKVTSDYFILEGNIDNKRWRFIYIKSQ